MSAIDLSAIGAPATRLIPRKPGSARATVLAPTFAPMLALGLALLFLLGGCISAPPAELPRVEERSDSRQSVDAASPADATDAATAAPVLGASYALLESANERAATGDLPGAIDQVERAIRLEPAKPTLWARLGELQLAANDLTRAEQFARKSIALAGTNLAAQRPGWLLLADVFDARGESAEAADLRARWATASDLG